MKDDDDCGSVLFNRGHLRIDHSVMLAEPTRRDLVMYSCCMRIPSPRPSKGERS
jgi:hypothetical protein